MNGRQLLSNSLANILAGLFGALASIVVPFMLARQLPSPEFALWALVSQAATYTTLFSLGLQSVVAQRIAVFAREQDAGGISSVLSASSQVMVIAAMAYLALAIVAAFALPMIYPTLTTTQATDGQWSLLYYSLGLSSTLIAVVPQGYFAGLGRSQRSASAIIPNRILIIAAAWVAAISQTVLAVAASIGAVLLIGSLHQWINLKAERQAGPTSSLASRTASLRRSILADCAPLALWSFATFLIYGGTTAIVSLSDYSSLPAYSLASSVSGLLLGLLSTAFAPMIPFAATKLRQGDSAGVHENLGRFTTYVAVVALLSLAVLIAIGRPVFGMVLPHEYVDSTFQLATLLIAANSVRLLMLPYSNLVIASRQQDRILATPFVEAICAFGMSLALAPLLGARGVAISLLIGACASLLHHFFWNMPTLDKELPVQREHLATKLIIPALSIIAILMGFAAWV